MTDGKLTGDETRVIGDAVAYAVATCVWQEATLFSLRALLRRYQDDLISGYPGSSNPATRDADVAVIDGLLDTRRAATGSVKGDGK